jgi:hypothetical protein
LESLAGDCVAGLVDDRILGCPVSAQNARAMAQGRFTLPYEVHWKSTVLPPGDYTFRLQETPSWTTVGLQGPNGDTQITALAIDSEASKESSKLKIEHRDGVDYVHDLYVAEAGLQCVTRCRRYRKASDCWRSGR